MIEFLKQLKWQFLIFQRNNLTTMIIGITVFYALVIYFLRDLGNIEKLLTLIIISDPALIGYIFIGFSIILEKDQAVLPALFITPLNHHVYLLSRVLTLSITCLFCALAMVFVAKGISFNVIHFSVGILSTTMIFSFIGIYIVSYTTEILHYILRSIPVLIFLSLPLLNYFDLTDFIGFDLLPMRGSLWLISNSYLDSPNIVELILGYLSIALWTPLIYCSVYRIFKSKIVYA